MKITSNIFEKRDFFYKHQLTLSPPCDAYSAHTHNSYELLFFVSGDATHIIEDRKYKLKGGDLILIPPMKHHFIRIDSQKDYERYNILFDAASLGERSAELISDDTEVINLLDNPIAKGIFDKLDYYYSNLSREDFGEVISLLLKELFYNINIEKKYLPPEEFSVTNPLVSSALKIINEELYTIEGVSEIAKRLFVTESYLFRIFKKELLRTPKRYINEKRLLAAQRMIRLGERPTVACERCGFRDYTSFYRSYLKLFGQAPSSEKQKG
ncbi:MAG: AraC family transcriptional regulator [Clostridia bacterium]|nr:AraC family transcriptional regulator [Clostridia bacterium]MBQ8720296.1 AraC family transcriptional regulator [Clostridia bacterium]